MSEFKGICTEGYIVITTDEYADLLDDSNKLAYLQNALFDHAKLSWNGEQLNYDYEPLNAVLDAMTRRYGMTLDALLKRKEREEKEKEKEEQK